MRRYDDIRVGRTTFATTRSVMRLKCWCGWRLFDRISQSDLTVGSDSRICHVDLDVLVHAKQIKCIVEREIPIELVGDDARSKKKDSRVSYVARLLRRDPNTTLEKCARLLCLLFLRLLRFAWLLVRLPI